MERPGGINIVNESSDKLKKIQTERLDISPFTDADIITIHRLHQYELVSRFNTVGIPKSAEDTRMLIEPIIKDMWATSSPVLWGWTIREKISASFVGEVGLRLAPKRFRMGEIHYNLIPDKWGKGYGLEATLAILRFGFFSLNLHRIEAGVAVDNQSSIKLLERMGMIREGVKRKILPLKSGWSDNYIYAILEEDFLL